MRGRIRSGGNVGIVDNDARLNRRDIVVETCAGCGEETTLGELIVFRDELWCVDCATEAARDELLPPVAQLEDELRDVRSAAAVARRRERAELNGVSVVRGASDQDD